MYVDSVTNNDFRCASIQSLCSLIGSARWNMLARERRSVRSLRYGLPFLELA